MASKVLVIEDDSLLASAFRRLFRKERIDGVVVEKTDQAVEYMANNQITTLVVDCLLPGISGVDFVQSIRKSYPEEKLDVILISGVFTESTFVRDAVRSTKAIAFFKKPFSVDELLPHLVKVQRESVVEINPRKALYQLFGREGVTARHRRRAIEALETVHGFDIPYLFALLVDGRMSGHLNIINEFGSVYGISFSNGFVVHVDVQDQESFLGKLLFEEGYLNSLDLAAILSEKSSLMLGERLIRSHLLSPHAFDEVIVKQMCFRLGRTIFDENIKVNFVPADVPLGDHYVDHEQFMILLHDWCASKISNEWLQAHFTSWETNHLMRIKSPLSSEIIKTLPLVQHHLQVIDHLEGKTLIEINEIPSINQNLIYKLIHFFVLCGFYVFKDAGGDSNTVKGLDFYRRMLNLLHGKEKQTVKAIVVAMTKGTSFEDDAIYTDFVRFIGAEPDPSDAEALAEFKKLRDLIKDFKKSSTMPDRPVTTDGPKVVQKSELERRIEASKLFEEMKVFLYKGGFKEARSRADKIMALDNKIPLLKVYVAWAKAGGNENNPRKADVIKEAEMELLQVDPEEKLDAHYSLVLGIIHKVKGEFAAAKKFYEKALAIDSNLIVARRELTQLASASQKQDIFSGDLKTLVGSLFGKRK